MISVNRINLPRAELLKVMRTFADVHNIRSLGFEEHTRKAMMSRLAFVKAVDIALSAQKEFVTDGSN